MSTWPTMRVAHYELEEEIGRGGAGVVYRAHDTRLDRRVAVKVLHPALVRDSALRARFLAESRLAGRLQHPNILSVYEAGEDGDALYIVTPLIRGTDLSVVIAEDKPLDPARAVGLAAQIASALDAAHAAGLVHRDVKPSNVLIAPSGEGVEHAYLADFGLAKALGGDVSITTSGQFLGTLDYCSPEQAAGRATDASADVYSLGCVLYECLVGHVPFPHESAAAVLLAHVNERPPRPSAERAELPGAVDEVLGRALAKDPSERYPRAGDLAAAASAAVAAPARRRRPATARATHDRVAPRTRLLQAASALALTGAVAIVVAGPAPVDAIWIALLSAVAVSLALVVDARFAGAVEASVPVPPEVWLDESSERLVSAGWDARGRRLGLAQQPRPLLVVVFALCAVLPAVVYVLLARRAQVIDLSAQGRRGAGSAVTARYRGTAARRAARRIVS